MSYSLLIIESPNKVATISQWLDSKEWKIIATVGHIINLPTKEYSIKEKNGEFIANWKPIAKKRKLLAEIGVLIKNATDIFIGTDDDIEGERIAYDIVEYYSLKSFKRVLFREITKDAIINGLKNAAYINEDRVKAQKARRIIDRITGYSITPAIRWYFKKNNLLPEEQINKIGLGRVSAAALAILVRNEKKVINFTPKIFRRLKITYFYNGVQFEATNQIKYFEEHFEDLNLMYEIISNESNNHIVELYKYKLEDKAPFPPLTTTRTLRAINTLLHTSVKDTMNVLQDLFEGVYIKGRKIGIITYPRTSSYNISDTFIDSIRLYIKNNYSEEFLSDTKRVYKKSKGFDNDAHEAIRPTKMNIDFSPDALEYDLKKLSDLHFEVYKFIFFRTIATQMTNSRYDRSQVIISIGGNKFKGFSNVRIFEGWEILNDGLLKTAVLENEHYEVALPELLTSGLRLNPISINIKEDVEQKPPRIGQGRFVTILENYNIGKQSTVAEIAGNLIERRFVKVEANMLIPTVLGMTVVEFAETYCEWLVNIETAGEFESELDDIEAGGDAKALIKKYDDLKNCFFNAIGFEKKEIDFSSNKFQKKSKKDSFVGKCILCKKGDVYKTEKCYSCSNYECNAVLWKNSANDFLLKLGKDFNEVTLELFLDQLFKTKKVFLEGLLSKKRIEFSAYIILKKNDYYKEKNILQLSLKF